MISVFAACSGKTGADNAASGVTGNVAFNLSWGDGPSRDAGQYNSRQVTGDVCADYHIQRIHAQAVDQAGDVQTSGEWTCARRQGELTGLPAGIYNIVIQGEVSDAVAWRGEATHVAVARSQQTNAGVIQMVHLHDHAAPVVVHTLPADGSRGVPVDVSLSATFDAAIVAASINTDNFILTRNDASGNPIHVAATVSFDSENHTAVLKPRDPLLNDTTYAAAIAVDGGMVVEDLAGNAMQQTVQWTFTTYRPDVEAPAIQSRSPEHGTMDVPLSPVVQIRFSEGIDPETITKDNIYLELNGVFVQGVLNYDEQLNLVTLTPESSLSSGATYGVTVTSDVLDLAGNPMAAEDSWSFVTQYPLWRTENIDGIGAFAGSRITLEKNETVHVAVSKAAAGQMTELIRTAENTWSIESISGSVDVGLNFDMVIEDEENVRLSTYFHQGANEIHFESRGVSAGGALYHAIVNLDDPVTDPQWLRIAADPSGGWGRAAICYFDAGATQLKFTAEAISWDHEIVDTAAGRFPALAVSPDTGVAHISYYDQVNGQLKYATRAPQGTWIKEPVDNDTDVGLYTDIALDANGNPHISYRDEHNSALKYAARQPSGQWLIETVDDSGNVGEDTSIALDSLGLAHISYYDNNTRVLKYAARSAIDKWHTQIVDNDGVNGFGSSITVDSQNCVHISYCYSMVMVAHSYLRYATTRPAN